MKNSSLILPLLIIMVSCGGNPSGPETDPDPISQFTEDDLIPEGTIVETETGFTVDGSLTLQTATDEDVVFLNADLAVEINPDGSVQSISGTAQIPSPSNFVEFANPVQADIGYFSGKFLNENRDFDVLLKENTAYFVFNITVAIEMKIGTNDDPDATKPFSIKPPLGGKIVYVADYNDPMFFFAAAQDLLGSFCFGASLQGRLPFVPLQPVDQVAPFDGITVRCGSFSFFKVIEVGGTMIRNIDFDFQLVESDPLGSRFDAGFQAGINGSFDLSLPISGFISFGIPLGEASGAIVTEVGTSGVIAKAFINGLAAPDNSWWPDFVPIKPGGQIRATGVVQQDGSFELGLSGEFNIELPATTERYAGAVRATNDEFTLQGTVTHEDLTWTASTTFRTDETEFAATPPASLLDDIGNLVNAQIDSAFDEIVQARQDLQNAISDYEFELSLRGLRASLPTITNEARSRLSSGLSSAESTARSQIRSALDDEGLKLCSDNLGSVLSGVAAPFFAALDRLRAAAEDTQDNDQTRNEIEAALRDLANRRRLQTTVSVRLTVASKIIGCGITSTQNRNVDINAQVLTDQQVAQILEAADNVQFIGETSSRVVSGQQILDNLPTEAELDQIRNDLQSGAKQIQQLNEVGFIKNHQTQSYSFFIGLNGQRRDVSEFDLFDANGVAGSILGQLL